VNTLRLILWVALVIGLGFILITVWFILYTVIGYAWHRLNVKKSEHMTPIMECLPGTWVMFNTGSDIFIGYVGLPCPDHCHIETRKGNVLISQYALVNVLTKRWARK